VDRVQPGGNGPALFLNPADDNEFVRDVEQVMEEGVAEAAELERVLRRSYPRAVVRPRDLSNEPYVVWYVYRDGHWVASVDGGRHPVARGDGSVRDRG
jgi:hypothetical protein